MSFVKDSLEGSYDITDVNLPEIAYGYEGPVVNSTWITRLRPGKWVSGYEVADHINAIDKEIAKLKEAREALDALFAESEPEAA